MEETIYTIEGTALTGYWLNVGPGRILRLGPIFPSQDAAARYWQARGYRV